MCNKTKVQDSGGRTYGVLQLRIRRCMQLAVGRGEEDCLAGLFLRPLFWNCGVSRETK
jgi:hypothetical protein